MQRHDLVMQLGLEKGTEVSRPGPGLVEAEHAQSRGKTGSGPRCTLEASPSRRVNWAPWVPVLGGADKGTSGPQRAGPSG